MHINVHGINETLLRAFENFTSSFNNIFKRVEIFTFISFAVALKNELMKSSHVSAWRRNVKCPKPSHHDKLQARGAGRMSICVSSGARFLPNNRLRPGGKDGSTEAAMSAAKVAVIGAGSMSLKFCRPFLL